MFDITYSSIVSMGIHIKFSHRISYFAHLLFERSIRVTSAIELTPIYYCIFYNLPSFVLFYISRCLFQDYIWFIKKIDIFCI